MKFTTPLLIASILFTFNNLVFAQSINISTAKKIAQNYLLSVGQNKLKSASPIQPKFQFSSHSVTSESKDTLYFVLNDTINHSFVIVAADKRSMPIIGYSLEGNYNENNQPPAFVAWMENKKKELEYIKGSSLLADSKIDEQWEKLSQVSSNDATGITSVEPIIQTKWDQGCFYNAMCPADEAGPCGHVRTGCTITALAQIMKFWNYPTKGTGTHSYIHPTYGNLSADFGTTTYQWAQMPNVVTSRNDAVATLMYHLGVSLDTDYSPGGSGAFYPREALVDYFNYSLNALWVTRSSLKTNEWIKLLKSELDLQHPIWYTGGDSIVGHSFVCDGYQDTDFFHFNWGWSGICDGYFNIGDLNPSGYSLNENQFVLIT